jgi:hypothetical protein
MKNKNKIQAVALAAAYAGSIVAIANELWTPSVDDGNIKPGIIYAANEARFVTSSYSEGLTGYLQGWTEPENLEQLLEDIAPMVSSGKRFEFKKADNSEAFLSEDDDVRSIGANYKRVTYKGSTVQERTYNKGLTIRLDKDDMVEGEEEQSVEALKSRLLRNEIRRALALLRAAATNTDKVWDATKNPDKDVRDRLRVASTKSGLRPTRVLIAEDAFDLRADAYELQNTPAAGVAANKTPDQLAAKWMVDSVKIVKAKYQSTLTAKAQVQNALTVLMYMAQKGLSKNDPSNIKRFVSDNGWKVFRKEDDLFVDISVAHNSNIVITSTLGIEQLTVAAA